MTLTTPLPLIGEIRMIALPFAPKNWLLCKGQMLKVQEYRDLFTAIGTSHGGNGHTTFALPDLRGQLPAGTASSIHFIIAAIGMTHSMNTED